ncbi:MAG: acyloxyacyl hydrolase [Alphaproteobacteria bacterium]
MKTVRALASCAALLPWLAGTAPASAGEPEFLAFGAGGFDVNDDQTSGLFTVEYRSDRKRFYVAPMVGLMSNSDGGVYGYGGVFLDVYFGRRWVVTPNFALGGWRRGDSKDLGDTLEFRSGVEIAYRFDNRSRLGITFNHISNAGIGDSNPGTESLLLTYAVPLHALF